VFGRVGTGEATSVEIDLPGQAGTLTTPVRDNRFFLVSLPQNVMTALANLEAVVATAKDADERPSLSRPDGSCCPTYPPTQPARLQPGDGRCPYARVGMRMGWRYQATLPARSFRRTSARARPASTRAGSE
jgi:hypothetical protein